MKGVDGIYLLLRLSEVLPATDLVLISVLNSTFASSAPSGELRSIQASLGAGQEVSILVVSMYIVGYVVGPIVFAPV